LAKVLPKYRVLLVGCGLSGPAGIDRNLKAFIRGLLGSLTGPDCAAATSASASTSSSASALPAATIIDADGLNVLSELPEIALPLNTILTPHPKELSRLMNCSLNEILSDRVGSAVRSARKFGATVILKGHRTVVTDGERVFVNTTGNSSLAKAGTGDVLTGMTAGLSAQGLSTLDASCLAVYLHGLAGELASADKTEYGVLASDIPSYIPLALKSYGS
jgi:NAD(P)H-hydrate epimerase